MRRALGTTRSERWTVAGRTRFLRVALLLGALVALPLLSSLAACSGSASSDPFVGTWNEAGSPPPIIIAKLGSDCEVTTFHGAWPHADRDGNVLHVWSGAKPTPGFEFYLTYRPASGQLRLTDPLGSGGRVLYSKASDSTSVPSPFPLPTNSATSSP